MVTAEPMDSILQEILFSKEKYQANLIPILQEVQMEYGYLSKENMIRISEYLEISPNEVYGVASFYQQFKFTEPGKHIISVCLGTACFVKGSGKVLDKVTRHLKCNVGETTEDREYSLDLVRCIGACGLAPVMVVDEDTYGETDPSTVIEVIEGYRTPPDED